MIVSEQKQRGRSGRAVFLVAGKIRSIEFSFEYIILLTKGELKCTFGVLKNMTIPNYMILKAGIEELSFLRMWSDKLGIKDRPIVDLTCEIGTITIP
ncbi:hypothetical protein AM501_13840 [Aneurinibacillus migulanus]|nr:hypothetical protein AM501_13840 [Aneurinibacillus migulanus]